MNITIEKITLEMSYNELWTLAFSLKRDIESTIDTHWVNHQANWKQNESHKLNMLRELFYSLGRPDLYEDIFDYSIKSFGNYNSKSN